MPTYIHLANLIINKAAVEEKVDGGCDAFRKYLHERENELLQEDDELFSLTRMNYDEFNIDKLVEFGLDFDEKKFCSKDFVLIVRYGGEHWSVDWLENNTIFAWHIESDVALIEKAKKISNMFMDEIAEMQDRGENPLVVISKNQYNR
jgi:hypothetical protein